MNPPNTELDKELGGFPCPHGRLPSNGEDGWKHCPHCLGLNSVARGAETSAKLESDKSIDECHSYNGDYGTTPEVLLTMLTSISPEGKREYKDVAVEACIAPVIQHLWDKGVSTGGSCCGHGKRSPSIVLEQGAENYSQIREWIKEKDERQFELTQWKRVLV